MARTIETARLRLRPPAPDDCARITALVRDPRVYRNVASIAPEQTEALTAAFLDRAIAKFEAGQTATFAVELEGVLVGLVGGGGAGGHGPADFGYWLAPEVWGRGFATEASIAAIDWMRREHGRRALTAGYFVDNPASGRVLRKLGFLPAGRRPYPCAGRGCDVDCVDMAWIA